MLIKSNIDINEAIKPELEGDDIKAFVYILEPPMANSIKISIAEMINGERHQI